SRAIQTASSVRSSRGLTRMSRDSPVFTIARAHWPTLPPYCGSTRTIRTPDRRLAGTSGILLKLPGDDASAAGTAAGRAAFPESGETMGFRYAVLGAGRQGCAAAWDLARHGEADEIRIFDADSSAAARAAVRINTLADRAVAGARPLDAADGSLLAEALRGCHATLSALPYRLNPAAARAALRAGSSFNDLGGNTAIVQEELALHDEALGRGVSIVPDCGLAPGLANVLAAAGIGRLDAARSVKMWCGGPPRNRDPPWGQNLVVTPGGRRSVSWGGAIRLRGGGGRGAPALPDPEPVEFPQPVGPCEAFLTSGGTSTCPWSFRSTLESFEYKTVRYPGH